MTEEEEARKLEKAYAGLKEAAQKGRRIEELEALGACQWDTMADLVWLASQPRTRGVGKHWDLAALSGPSDARPLSQLRSRRVRS